MLPTHFLRNAPAVIQNLIITPQWVVVDDTNRTDVLNALKQLCDHAGQYVTVSHVNNADSVCYRKHTCKMSPATVMLPTSILIVDGHDLQGTLEVIDVLVDHLKADDGDWFDFPEFEAGTHGFKMRVALNPSGLFCFLVNYSETVDPDLLPAEFSHFIHHTTYCDGKYGMEMHVVTEMGGYTTNKVLCGNAPINKYPGLINSLELTIESLETGNPSVVSHVAVAVPLEPDDRNWLQQYLNKEYIDAYYMLFAGNPLLLPSV